MRYYIFLLDDKDEPVDLVPLCEDLSEIKSDVIFPEFKGTVTLCGWGVLDTKLRVKYISKFGFSNDLHTVNGGSQRWISGPMKCYEYELTSMRHNGIRKFVEGNNDGVLV